MKYASFAAYYVCSSVELPTHLLGRAAFCCAVAAAGHEMQQPAQGVRLFQLNLQSLFRGLVGCRKSIRTLLLLLCKCCFQRFSSSICLFLLPGLHNRCSALHCVVSECNSLRSRKGSHRLHAIAPNAQTAPASPSPGLRGEPPHVLACPAQPSCWRGTSAATRAPAQACPACAPHQLRQGSGSSSLGNVRHKDRAHTASQGTQREADEPRPAGTRKNGMKRQRITLERMRRYPSSRRLSSATCFDRWSSRSTSAASVSAVALATSSAASAAWRSACCSSRSS